MTGEMLEQGGLRVPLSQPGIGHAPGRGLSWAGGPGQITVPFQQVTVTGQALSAQRRWAGVVLVSPGAVAGVTRQMRWPPGPHLTLSFFLPVSLSRWTCLDPSSQGEAESPPFVPTEACCSALYSGGSRRWSRELWAPKTLSGGLGVKPCS